ncbi:MAG: isoamylase [Parachlamydia sp.]|nr:isoamylase [Parachlamydia sp.]
MQPYQTERGFPRPYGVSRQGDGINFALSSHSAYSVALGLFDRQTHELTAKITLDPAVNQTGGVWHILVKGLTPDTCYAYFIGDTPLLDPYAREVATGIQWGTRQGPYQPLGALLMESEPFDWQDIEPPCIPIQDLIIYEAHVRSFTQHPSSHVKHPGTFLGMVEKIPELVKLGINAIELLPLQEFDEQENKRINPNTHKPLYQFWGYSTVNFFAPMNRYATEDKLGAATREFKTLVREMHKNGIEVYLDVVFNHTAEGNHEGPMLSFKGIDPAVYYLLDPNGNYSDYSGCGNSFNANHPVVRQFILDCLRYWVLEMHVDGFRFDLASALLRGRQGQPLEFAPLIEAITDDPLLANIKLFAEPWDAVGLYNVGNFWPSSPRWGEWNGRYRDSVRQFIKGTPGIKGDFVTRLCGSQDLYWRHSPTCSVNFVTVHDGFTLRDLVSYNVKHNLENGEDNHDGNPQNDSWNCGVEGPSEKENVRILRQRQMRNFHLVLMISQGVPLLLMGDEYGHTKLGNNNTYCLDDEKNWYLWNQLDKNGGFYRFYQKLIHFRKTHPLLKRTKFFSDNGEIVWHGLEPFNPDWGTHNQFFAFALLDPEKDPEQKEDLYIAFNAQNKPVELEIPKPENGRTWKWVVNTANPSPEDYYDQENAPVLRSFFQIMPSFSAIMLKLAH